ncbi:hypothetical protein pb186bvf_016158 [Paramecium bursaria]
MSTKKLYGKVARSNSKQSVTQQVSMRKRFSSLCSPQSNIQCVFCSKFQYAKQENYSPLLTKALFSKYSSSQNYYYSKDINDILDNESTAAVVFYRDLETMVEQEEYLKRTYIKRDIHAKQKALLEYYKYHHDIPRLFMTKVYVTINKFHEKKRRIEYAAIKRKLNIPDEDTKSPKKKQKPKQSDDDCSVGQLKHLLKDLNLENLSYFKKKNDISSSMLLREVLSVMGKQYDNIGSISGLMSINQSHSLFIESVDFSIIHQQPHLAITKKRPQVPIIKQLQKQNSQFSQQSSFEKAQQKQSSEIKGELTKRSSDIGSPLRNCNQPLKKSYKMEGFSNFVQQQYQQVKQQQMKNTQVELKRNDLTRKVSGNFSSSDYQLKVPSRQPSTRQEFQQTYQSNFNKGRVGSHFSSQPMQDEEIAQSPLKINTERPQPKSYQKNINKTSSRQASLYVSQKAKFNQFAIATLKNLQIKNKEELQKTYKPVQDYNNQQVHFRTKSTDTIQTYRTSPPKRQDSVIPAKDPLKLMSSVYVQGSNKKNSVYNINQNNIVNIYIEDAKKVKVMGGSQTARLNSPLRTQAQFQRHSPSAQKKRLVFVF